MGQSACCETDQAGALLQSSYTTVESVQEHCAGGAVPSEVSDVGGDVNPRHCTDDAGGRWVALERSRIFSPHLHSKFHNHYKQERLLGEGSHGQVFAAVARRGAKSSSPKDADVEIEAVAEPVRYVAVKCFQLNSTRGAHDRSEHQVRERVSRKASFERERSMLAQLEHPHIAKMYECFEEKDRLWIVLELCHGGELYQFIADHVTKGKGGLEDNVARDIFRQMLTAISYLHSKQVVHRDVKTENFLLVHDPASQGVIVKLCDFGAAVYLGVARPRAMELIGTLSYTAPEIYCGLGASFPADNWSLGVCLYVLVVGASPFRITGQEPREETIRRICSGQYETRRQEWAKTSRLAQQLVQHLLVVPEQHRLTSADALQHAWLDPTAATVRSPTTVELSRPSWRKPSAPRIREDELIHYMPCARALLGLLVRFAKLDLLQQLILTICAQMTPDTELLRWSKPVPWYDLYFALDANRDGHLSIPEFVQGLRYLFGPARHVPEDRIQALASSLDTNGSGSIEWVEWVALCLLSLESTSIYQEPLLTAFRLLDRPSGDSNIGAADLLAVISLSNLVATVPSVDGRELAVQILRRWALQEPKASKRAGLPPSLHLADVQKMLLEATAKEEEGSEDEVCVPCSLAADGDSWLPRLPLCKASRDGASGLSNCRLLGREPSTATDDE